MFKCKECKKVFKSPTVTNLEPETGFADVICPFCGSDYLDEVILCTCGKNYTTEDFCDDCYEQVMLTLNKLKSDLDYTQNNFEKIIANHFGW